MHYDEAIRANSTLTTLQTYEPNAKLTAVDCFESAAGGVYYHPMQVDSFWWRGHSYYDLWWRGTWEKEGGGCTLNHAVHHIDMLSWMMGQPETVSAVMRNLSHDNAEVEDLSIPISRKKDSGFQPQKEVSVDGCKP